jgi:DNA-binding XRE family transcriptional regulator
MKTEWTEGSVQDFMGLSDADMALIETRVSLTKLLRARRLANRITQTKLAHDMKTSQSRVAKIESGDPSVSLDLILRALFAIGAKPADVGRQMLALS